MRHHIEERSLLRRAAILFTILFFFNLGAASAQTAAGTITGTVRAADTLSLMPNLAVGVYPANDQNNRLTYVRTNPEGSFSLTGLAAGSYKIRFFTTGIYVNYIGGWYKRSTAPSAVETFSEGSAITLTSSVGADLGETQLQLGLTITGKVTKAADSAVGIAGVYAQAYLKDGTTWVRTSDAATATADGGNYTISGLREGSYKVRFWAYKTEYTTVWYSASATAEPTHTVTSAADATLVATGTTGIDGQLSTGGSISGTVSKITDTGTAPVAGALVLVYDYADPHAFRGFTTSSADAGAEGTYIVSGLPMTGSYIVQFYEKFVNNVESGLTEWYDGSVGAYTQNGAAAVTIEEDGATSGIDAVLDRGPISGKVSYITGSPVLGVTVKIAPSAGGDEKNAVTDAKGLYSIPELSSSTDYTVRFWKNNAQIGEKTPVAAGATGVNLQIDPPPPSQAAKLIPIYKRLLLKKRCYIINGVRVCR